MLDQNTKRKIDSARQILVGKVPDPKAQVEQITTALIYKFMDDMDKESEELGGKTNFFTKEYSKYSWTKLLDNKLSGQERLNLYVQAITSMSKNPYIPQLFRNIFKGAFLPYNDPRTLSLFLKEINEFTYEHSENLGNAFEYLLSVLGSQGDAGQFRTPRHIIDFIVEVVAPKKNETILDPACGTAGFLISAYKYILKTNKQKPLTPAERLKLPDNIKGYDISPDMVKLSLVNMYLHGFTDPKIYEYDTLTSEKFWDDDFDVILANPPFMTPKGGIRPHKRFSIQANRSEVLFVDYIMEHLTLKGRAGIIVPEGIIFQTSNAYNALRKKLVEDGLFAVVSLPSGVFNPYAGVKTSILFFDKEFTKKAKDLLFVKISNDGFSLGAQRREVEENDLPTALKIINKYRLSINDKKFTETEKEIAHIVPKKKIAETSDYNLTGDRYKEAEISVNQKWPMVELGEIIDVLNGYAFKSKNYVDNGIRVIRITNVQKGEIVDDDPKYYSVKTKEPINKYKLYENDILISLTGNVGRVGVVTKKLLPALLNQRVACIRIKTDNINLKFLFYMLNRDSFENACMKNSGGVAQKNLSTTWLSKYKIPLPPLSVQKEIVEKIEVKQKAIDAAKEVIENLERERRYFGEDLIGVEGIKWVGLEEVCEINPKKKKVKNKNIEVGFVPMSDIEVQNYHFIPKQTRKIREVYKGYTYFTDNDVLLAKITPCFENGKAGIIRKLKNGIGFGSTEFIVLRANKKTIPEWIYNFVANERFINGGKNFMTGTAGQKRLNIDFVRSYKIPLPSLKVQKEMVARAEEEQKIIDANKRLIEIMEQKIQKIMGEI